MIPNPSPNVEASTPVDASATASTQWMVQWFDNSKSQTWKLDPPQFKHCKKRKEFFSSEFSEIWYKAPYKYNLKFKASTGTDSSKEVRAWLDVVYESCEPVRASAESSTLQKKKKSKQQDAKQQTDSSTSSPDAAAAITNFQFQVKPKKRETEKRESNSSGDSCELNCGPFQFNVCSYNHDGKKFRLCIFLALGETTICCMISPPFSIKAKKPISKPGSKKNKVRVSSESDEASDGSPTTPPSPSSKRPRRRTVEASVPSTLKITPGVPAIGTLTSLKEHQQQAAQQTITATLSSPVKTMPQPLSQNGKPPGSLEEFFITPSHPLLDLLSSYSANANPAIPQLHGYDFISSFLMNQYATDPRFVAFEPLGGLTSTSSVPSEIAVPTMLDTQSVTDSSAAIAMQTSFSLDEPSIVKMEESALGLLVQTDKEQQALKGLTQENEFDPFAELDFLNDDL